MAIVAEDGGRRMRRQIQDVLFVLVNFLVVALLVISVWVFLQVLQ